MPYEESNEDEHKDFDGGDTAPVTNETTEQENTPNDESQEEWTQSSSLEAKPVQDIVRPARVATTPPRSAENNIAAAVNKPRKQTGWRIARIAAEAILVIAVIFLAVQYANLRSDKQNLNEQLVSAQNNPQALVQKQSQAIIDKVGALMQLPTNETPTVAAVSDAAAARTQSNFFANAQNGDKVLMYVKAGQAILYRPSTNKVILVAPLTFSNQAATTTTTPATTKTTR
jgi:hypothetical protein